MLCCILFTAHPSHPQQKQAFPFYLSLFILLALLTRFWYFGFQRLRLSFTQHRKKFIAVLLRYCCLRPSHPITPHHTPLHFTSLHFILFHTNHSQLVLDASVDVAVSVAVVVVHKSERTVFSAHLRFTNDFGELKFTLSDRRAI